MIFFILHGVTLRDVPPETTQVRIPTALNQRLKAVSDLSGTQGRAGLTKEQLIERFLDQSLTQVESNDPPQDTIPEVHHTRSALRKTTHPITEARVHHILRLVALAKSASHEKGSARVREQSPDPLTPKEALIIEVTARMYDDPRFFRGIESFVELTRP